MLTDHFYHATIRRMVAAFGTLFNDINVHKTDSNGNIITVIKVPLSYGPIRKFLARIEQQDNLRDQKLAIKLPRMSFEITSITYDSTAKINKQNIFRKATSDPAVYNTIRGPIPYRMGIQLNIITKNQDDALQVLEQILPYFQPEYTLTINDIPGMDIKGDSPIVLQNVTMSVDYEADYESRETIIYTLDFETRIRFYGNTTTRGVIERASVDLNIPVGPDEWGFVEELVADSQPTIRTGVDTTDDNEITP